MASKSYKHTFKEIDEIHSGKKVKITAKKKTIIGMKDIYRFLSIELKMR